MARRSYRRLTGKKIVYVTEFRNAAVEVAKMYQKKGENAKVEREMDASGAIVFIVAIYPR